MKIKIKLDDKFEAERMALVVSIGISEALKNNLMSINEAENCFFNLHTINILEGLGVNQSIIELVQLGCELEDVESLIPHKLQDSIEFIRVNSLNLMSKMSQPNLPVNRWIE